MATKRTFLADFHVHTRYSDGRLSLPQVIDLYGQRGFGAIAITDHIAEQDTLIGKAAVYLNQVLREETFPAYLADLEQERQRAWDRYGMVVIPGFELSKNSISNHRSAHIVGLGISRFLAADGDALDLCKQVRSQGGIAIAAHPVFTRRIEKQTYHLWDRREELRPFIDAWEVASGPFLFDEVMRTDLPKIASSDLHLPRHLTAWKTVLHCELHPEAILAAIRRQQVDFRFYSDPVPERERPKLSPAPQPGYLMPGR